MQNFLFDSKNSPVIELDNAGENECSITGGIQVLSG